MSANIRIKYSCQRCSAKVTGGPYRAPGKHLMGRVIQEDNVCVECLNKHVAFLEDRFWGNSGNMISGTCAGCPSKIDSAGSFVAHRYMKEDGTWQFGRICEDCFGEYKTHCASAAKGNTK